MSGCGAKSTISELVLSAVFYLQQKNGVSVMEVAEYIGAKKCCHPCKISRQIKVTLDKAKEHGIMSESKGEYRIEGKYEDKLEKGDLKPAKNSDDDEECEENQKEHSCPGINFDRDGEHRSKHKHGDGEIRENEGKLEDCIRDDTLIDENDEEMDEDEYRRRELGEPLTKKRKTHLKTRDTYDYAEEEDEDKDEDNCILDDLRYFERAE